SDRRITLAPFGLEFFEPKQGRVGVLGPIDRLEGGQDRLAILPGHERQAVSDQVHDAGLHHGLREHRIDRFGKALEPVDHRNEDVIDAARLEFVDDFQPEFGAFALFDPQSENVFFAVRIERERDVDRLVLDQALVANLDPQGVKTHHRIDRVERPVLPLPHLVQDRVGDPADEIGRHVGGVKFGQVALDLPHRHAARIEAQYLFVEALEPGLPLGDQLRLETAGAIARHRYLDLAIFGQYPLRTLPVTAVAFAPACRIALLVAEMFGQFRPKRALYQRLLELLE